MELALKGLQASGVMEAKHLRELTSRLDPAEPVLVHRLDKPNEYYYIVPMQGRERNTVSLVNINARFGNYEQSAFAAEEQGHIRFTPLTGEAILKLIGRRVLDVEEKRIINIYPEAVCIYSSLVWRPCRESLSPYLPFHMVTVGPHRIYVRVDGKVFNTLHIDDKGI
jgi:hypothetical protein